MKRVVLISVGQPSTNPRIVKEANSLVYAGYEVYLIYSYWTEWALENDSELFTKVKWKPIMVGGSPFNNRGAYFFTRLRFKFFKFLAANFTFKFGVGEIARGRTFPEQMRKAKSIKADLYIAHIQAALPAAIKAARKHEARCGFDAEDFHRQEVSDDTSSLHYRLSTYIEDKYLPLTDYITAASPLIAKQYAALYNRSVPFLLNVSYKTPTIKIEPNDVKPLRLFWFSQTIGANRGIETVIEAMGFSKFRIELHLLGLPADGYKEQLFNLAADASIEKSRICFYQPVPAEKIYALASQFDIGLASETGFSLNNKIALSNKIFTYLQSGLAVVASNTPAQAALINHYHKTGKIYDNAGDLAKILEIYNSDRNLLYQTRLNSYQTGQTELNWEMESVKFLKVIENV